MTDADSYLRWLQGQVFRATFKERGRDDGFVTEIPAYASLAATRAGQPVEASAIETRPGAYEHPMLYRRLMDRVRNVERALEGNLVAGLPNVKFGMLWTMRTNALAVPVPDSDEYLVLLESGMILFPIAFSGALASVPDSFERQGGSNDLRFDIDAYKALDGESEAVRRLVMAICDVLLVEPPFGRVGYTDEQLAALEGLAEMMDTFVVAHEYGHILCGHFRRARPAALRGDGVEIPVKLPSWADELEADAFVFERVANPSRSRGDLGSLYVGALLMFAGLDLVERAVALLERGDSEARGETTHPPAKDRARQLARLLRDSAGSSGIGSPEKFAEIVGQCTDELWKKALPYFVDLRSAGVRPKVSWLIVAR